jgi:hypothetical protein
MDWKLNHTFEAELTVEWFTTPEEAIERACRLIDGGCESCGINFGSGSETIQITKAGLIYQLWARSKVIFT